MQQEKPPGAHWTAIQIVNRRAELRLIGFGAGIVNLRPNRLLFRMKSGV